MIVTKINIPNTLRVVITIIAKGREIFLNLGTIIYPL
jgi:hypothetical protein